MCVVKLHIAMEGNSIQLYYCLSKVGKVYDTFSPARDH